MKMSFRNLQKSMSVVLTLVLALISLCSCDVFISPKRAVESTRETVPTVTETTREVVSQSLEDKIAGLETTAVETQPAEIIMDTTAPQMAAEVQVDETTLSEYIQKAIARPNDNVETDYDKTVLLDYIRKNYYENKVAEGKVSGNCFVIIVTDGPNEIFDEATYSNGQTKERTWKMYASPRMANETNIAKNFWYTTMDINMNDGFVVQHKYTRDSDFKTVTIDLEYLATKPDGLIIILPEMFR